MTSTLSPNDTGEISAAAETQVIVHPQPYLSAVDTERIDLGDGTRRMPSYLATAPISPIPRCITDQHAAIEIPDTIGIYPRPRGARHALTERVGYYPVVRPTLQRSGFRAGLRAAARRDRRARWATVVLLASLALLVVGMRVSGAVL